ncbi:Crp/Fnr family transcriptional regulator [Myroides sp. 1354]|uniref:Crp/Fnr family transcriptional regulator n=1 Tax=unclassified Myroides TaxID=2642485 RepID=UPI002574FDCE|nr:MULTISPECIES: Crp/Fnr family transcriptional regulator [unclassified Myroides]MDM1046328.1 Crp/Fnr family transcriptional regulator [Myroides sp. R163-1]MDM1057265.1 Crp/Fnr family transcriptional regulator [Myroides sp. 1354]MDM1070500.1 Crp/Fnr family transcriptional regulator [Myroides sp. 1372]
MEKAILFIEHIERFTSPLTPSEKASILSFFSFETQAKKTWIQEAGKPCTTLCFVLRGCLRSYYIKANGIEQTVDFAIEQWWLTDYLAFENQTSSDFYIQTVEPTDILLITSADFKALMVAHPIMEKYFRIIFQKAYGAAQRRLKFLYEYSREELYFHFEAQFPAFVQRIPQYLLASYLGFSPEYLSEIKKKRFS